jgi:maleylacetoacetate isomerase/maleylpyruvate isomerase
MLCGMKLYNYFRSSASFRVRIALALKQLPFDYVPVHLLKGEHKKPEFAALSADTFVPVLEDAGQQLSQSLAIMEYLEEVYPEPSLLPADPVARARVRALALSVACDIHPLNNLRVLKYLVRELKVSEDSKNEWYRHWCREGLRAVDRQLSRWGGTAYCVGDTPTVADCCLVPQVFNAQRFDVSLDDMPRVRAVFDLCMQHPAFQAADPARCPDAE